MPWWMMTHSACVIINPIPEPPPVTIAVTWETSKRLEEAKSPMSVDEKVIFWVMRKVGKNSCFLAAREVPRSIGVDFEKDFSIRVLSDEVKDYIAPVKVELMRESSLQMLRLRHPGLPRRVLYVHYAVPRNPASGVHPRIVKHK